MIQVDWLEGEALPVTRILKERDIQEACIRFAREQGAYARKFSSPANRSVPDYLILFRSFTWYVEFKAPGKVPTDKQREEHKKIQAAGGTVWVIDDIELFKDRWQNLWRP